MIFFRVVALFLAGLTVTQLRGADVDLAARAINELGIDLHRQLATGADNLCLSPYSIQIALAMTFAGADADTRTEMARVLHYPGESDAIHGSFDSLQAALKELTRKTVTIAEQSKRNGGPSEPIKFSIANRLFAQRGYDLRDSFRQIVKQFYDAPVELLDFRANPERARERINKWVADQTLERIRDLIPANGLTKESRLVLANAIYLKAPWQSEFAEGATKPAPFYVRDGEIVDLPTMRQRYQFGYAKRDGYAAVALPYTGGELQLLLLVPNEVNGLQNVEAKLTAKTFSECAKLRPQDVDLSLPRFKFAPPTIPLGEKLQALGMKTAFDLPPGSAKFDRMAARKPDDYLAISQVFHKTFIAVDEKGTEAAAATAVAMLARSARIEKPPPIEVKVDRPFLFAIQHVPSGACLFIGRVTDPR